MGKAWRFSSSFLLDKGAFVRRDGRYEIDFGKIKTAVRELVRTIS